MQSTGRGLVFVGRGKTMGGMKFPANGFYYLSEVGDKGTS